jgi:hypothetical protein
MGKKVYISGKITGLPFSEALAKFRRAEIYILEQGDEQFNPMLTFYDNWNEAMVYCIENLLNCDEILMLHDWKDSKGARIEHFIAETIGMKITYWQG